MPTNRPIIVTHHSPDLDAITATWLLKKFAEQKFGQAKVLFVNPGDHLSDEELANHCVDESQVVYVDTGGGEFDHHQPERGQQYLSAALLVYQYLQKLHPEIKNDLALKTIVDYVTEIDHFREIFWPEADSLRYNFMIQELIEGINKTHLHNDDSVLHFGFQCLDAAYANLTQVIKARQLITEKGRQFSLSAGPALAIETQNDNVIKEAQKQGFSLVVKRDPSYGHVRIKVRPDCPINLQKLAKKIADVDQVGSWYFHPSGKMLLNGSGKHRRQHPTGLSLKEIINFIKELYG